MRIGRPAGIESGRARAILRALCFALLLSGCGVVALLHPHFFVAVAAGAIVGLAYVLFARRAIGVAIALCPAAVLVVISAAAFSRPTSAAVVPDGGLLLAIGTFAAAGIACCLLAVYACARWTGFGLWASVSFVAVATFLAGQFLQGVVAVVREGDPPLQAAGTTATMRAFSLADRMTAEGLGMRALYIRYRGEVRLASCSPYARAGVIADMTFPRAVIERYGTRPLPFDDENGAPVGVSDAPPDTKELRDRLSRWFGGTQCDGNLITLDEANQEIHLHQQKSCREFIWKTNDYGQDLAVSILGLRLPLDRWMSRELGTAYVRFQGPAMFAGEGSVLTVTAPPGCIADTYPPYSELRRDGTVDRFLIPVGFPRAGLPLLELDKAVAPPDFVYLRFTDERLRSPTGQALVQAFLGLPGLAMLFLLTAFAMNGTLAGIGATLSPVPGRVARAIVRAFAWCKESVKQGLVRFRSAHWSWKVGLFVVGMVFYPLPTLAVASILASRAGWRFFSGLPRRTRWLATSLVVVIAAVYWKQLVLMSAVPLLAFFIASIDESPLSPIAALEYGALAFLSGVWILVPLLILIIELVRKAIASRRDERQRTAS